MTKIVRGALTLFLLIAIMLTSCAAPIAAPKVNPTDLMETSMAFVKTEIVETLTAAAASTPALLPPTPLPPTQTPSYDRHDPEAVVRAYFDAWKRTDGNMMDLLYGTNTYGHYGFEPTSSIKILEIQLVSSPSAGEHVYLVSFDVQYAQPHKKSGKTRWMFYLTWDVNRDAWIITNLATH